MRKTLQLFNSKAAFVALGIVIVCASVWIYFFIREREKGTGIEAMYAIPSDAVFALRVNKLGRFAEKLNDKGEIFSLLKQERSLREVRKVLQLVADTLAAENSMMADFAKQPLWMSAHVAGSNLNYLFLASLPAHRYSSDAKQLTALFARRGLTFVEQSYDKDETIFTFRRGETEVFHAAVFRRVLLVSTARVLIETAIREAKITSTLVNVPGFLVANKGVSANHDANIYVQHAQLRDFLSLFAKRKERLLTGLSNFTELDVTLSKDNIQFGGCLYYGAEQNSYFTVLQHQDAISSFGVFDVLPAVSNGVYAFAVSDAGRLFKDYERYYQHQSGAEHQSYRSGVARMEQKIKRSPAGFYASLQPAEIALAHVPFSGLAKNDRWFIILRSSNKNSARRHLDELAAALSGKKSKPERRANEALPIYSNPAPGITAALLGDFFSACADNYYVVLGDYLVFSSSPNALKDFALVATLGKTLSKNAALSKEEPKGNAFIYLNPKKSDAAYLDHFKEKSRNTLRNSSLLGAAGAMGVILRCGKEGQMFCNAFYNAQESSNDAGSSAQPFQQEFEFKMDAPLQGIPRRMKNHRNNEWELLVQDARNTLYLIDNQGTQIWKLPLSEPIMGDVVQVDILKNNKLQMVFNTRSKIFMIDRLGNNLPGFPVKLAAPATAPLAVFDYDGSRDYRLFIPCNNGKIYAYEGNAKPLTGFAPTISFGNIAQPLLHVRNGGRDFIVVADHRNLHLLDRRGALRVKVAEPVLPAPNSTIACERNVKGEVAHLTTTNTRGELVQVYFDGKTERRKLPTEPGEYHYFVMDAQNNYLILNNNRLTVYSPGLKSKLTASANRTASAPPYSFVPGRETPIYTVFSEDEGKVHLWDSDGDRIEGFPMQATAPALVTRLTAIPTGYHVIVGDKNGLLTCYRVR